MQVFHRLSKSRKIASCARVSDVQPYADLLNYPARGEEAAGEVYKLLEKRWKEAEPVLMYAKEITEAFGRIRQAIF